MAHYFRDVVLTFHYYSGWSFIGLFTISVLALRELTAFLSSFVRLSCCLFGFWRIAFVMSLSTALIYDSRAASLFGGGVQPDFRWKRLFMLSLVSSWSWRYSRNLSLRAKSRKSCCNSNLLTRGGLGQKERPLESKLTSAGESSFWERLTTVFVCCKDWWVCDIHSV